jgi:CheY-like chemotaxis protein/HPt (histidine-containing phosphotransfer) domain-containing protein
MRAGEDATPYDLALIDMQMPGMDGLALARVITADPTIAPLPLVLLTSLGHRQLSPAMQAAGITACLAKPVRPSHLFDCLVSVMAPARRAEPGVATGSATSPGFSGRPAALGPRLLLAEDNAVNQKVAVHMLEKLGYQADVVGDGRAALEALSRAPYPLILMDCQMPGLDGFAATAAIRQRERAARHTPIIAMTAGAMEGDRERCLAAGMDDYLAKPVREAELAAVLARWLPAAEEMPRTDPPSNGGRDATDAAGWDDGIDRTVLARIGDPARGGEPALLREVVALFRADGRPLLQELRAAAERGDADRLMRGAHKLRGSASNLGAERMSALCERLEALGRAHTSEGAAGLLDELDREWFVLDRVLDEETQRLAKGA